MFAHDSGIVFASGLAHAKYNTSETNNRINGKSDVATTPTANGGPKHTELRNNAINEAAETSMKQAPDLNY
ncbi:hypothetical protein IscW_ISCW022906 [Ixodes scapularis]|uniref:Uncharacterized protein n=1 Tax=Ixodes scapularis TaxID=6945 RepID=B7QBQ9_IXOSC|nr:hypothetical protein IscW_ISCW022906 [Ixodes scapularis]|eukprot:XP_002412973.1 hypothetical protein IscW_ISCW022906 [Ixodes scapularis]